MPERIDAPVTETPVRVPQAPIPLAEVRLNQEVVLAAIEGPSGLRHRLTEMGLRVGVRFIVRGGGKTGPLIIGIGDTRLVLGHGMAHRVLVYPVKP